MAPTEILARGFTFEVNDGTVGSPDWVTITNVNKWAHSPKSNDADTTSFDDAGRMSHFKASRGDEFTVTCLAQEDPDTGDKDEGQAACEVWAQEIGPDSVKQFRITSPAGTTLTFSCTSTVTVGGGGNDDPSAWELALVVTGSISNGSLGGVPGTPGSADATAANDSITGTWSVPSGSPTRYQIEVYIDSTDTVVATVETTIAAVLVTGLLNTTAYYFRVRGKNSAGWGAWSAVSDTVTTT